MPFETMTLEQMHEQLHALHWFKKLRRVYEIVLFLILKRELLIRRITVVSKTFKSDALTLFSSL